jgi:hypothetical protein
MTTERNDGGPALIDDLADALENLLTVWANEGKKPGWVDRFMTAKGRAHSVLRRVKAERQKGGA